MLLKNVDLCVLYRRKLKNFCDLRELLLKFILYFILFLGFYKMKNMDSLVELLPRFNTDIFFSKTVTYFGERIVNNVILIPH